MFPFEDCMIVIVMPCMFYRLFKHWSTKMEDFLEDCKDMVKWLYHPDIFNSSANTSDNKEEEGGKRRDSIYWDLFISWCKVFFLRPK